MPAGRPDSAGWWGSLRDIVLIGWYWGNNVGSFIIFRISLLLVSHDACVVTECYMPCFGTAVRPLAEANQGTDIRHRCPKSGCGSRRKVKPATPIAPIEVLSYLCPICWFVGVGVEIR